MGDTFTPDEIVANLLYAVDRLNVLLHDCDSRHEHLYADAIANMLNGIQQVVMLREADEGKA
jgi:hypothetical protein